MMNRLKNLKFNLKVVYLTIAFIVIVSIIFSFIAISYVNNNMLKDTEKQLQATSQIISNDILKKIETIDIIGSYIIDDTYLNSYLNKAYQNQLTLADKLAFVDSNLSGLEGIVNINNNIDYLRIYSTNDQVDELLPSFYASSRIANLSISDSLWLVNYQNNVFSNDDFLVGHFYNIYDVLNNKIAIVEIALEINNLFYTNNYDDIKTLIYHQGFFNENHDAVSDLLVQSDLENQTTFIKDNYLFHIDYLNEIDTYVINYQNLSGIHQTIFQIIMGIIIAVLIIVLCLSLLLNYLVKKLFQRFYLVLDGIKDISQGNLENVISVSGHDEISDLAIAINFLTTSFKEMMQKNIEIEVSDKESRIKALQSQINAHFIYNTLESIKMMAEIEEMYEMSDALTSLGKLLRYSMKWSNGLVILESEINYIQAYLALARLRFDYEITLDIDLETEVIEQVMPKMTLQPIIENSLSYGSDDSDLALKIKGYYENDDCLIEVIDYGLGMPAAKVSTLQHKIENGYNPDAKGSGIALVNIHRRIKVQFGDNYGLKVESIQNEYTKIIIRLPATRRIKGG